MRQSIRSLLSVLFIIVLFLFVIQYVFPVPCDRILRYSVGILDEGFGISREEFLAVIQEAEDAWEQPFHKELFMYDDTAKFTINLVYDDRQERTDRAKAVNTSLDQTLKNREEIKRQYDRALAEYEEKLRLYEANVVAYEDQARTLQADIQNTNAAGGASEEEYREYRERQKELTAKKEILEQEQINLNQRVEQVNLLAGSENKVIQAYNFEVEKLNEEFGDEGEFGQGVYAGDSITIYEFTNLQDLRLVLEHEFGHALGIGHIPNPGSVMYYLMHEKNSALDGPTEDDLAALAEQCEKTSFQIFIEYLRNAYAGLVL